MSVQVRFLFKAVANSDEVVIEKGLKAILRCRSRKNQLQCVSKSGSVRLHLDKTSRKSVQGQHIDTNVKGKSDDKMTK